jgi:hypothetical protein
MRRSLAILFSISISAACGLAVEAADNIKSGPQPGESIPGAFHFLNINGMYAGDPHCLVCEYGLKPVAAVFARSLPETNKPLAALLQKLDETVAKNQASEFRGFAAFLSSDFTPEDSPARKDLVQKLETVAKDLKNLIICVGPAEGPEKYQISKDAEITVLLYYNHKVVANFAFEKDKVGDKDVATIGAAFQKMTLKP